jgi:hypothetical protein
MIYFAQTQVIPYLVKIGLIQEDNLSLRLLALKSECKSELRLLFTLVGNRSEEQKLHSKFQDVRIGGEWFFPSKQLLDFIYKNIEKEKTAIIKKNDFYSLVNFKDSIDKDYDCIIKTIRDENRDCQKDNIELYTEIKRLLSENKALKLELEKLNQNKSS